MKFDANYGLLAVVALASCGLVAATVVRKPTDSKEYIRKSPTEIIGPDPLFVGDPNNATTLVVFFDYQCPPCRRAHREVEDLLRAHPKAFRIEYRNFPLSSLHPFAAEAALAANAAREQGKFFAMHDRLMVADFKSGTVDALVRELGLDRKRFDKSIAGSAKALLERDEKAGDAIGVEGTPALFLCTLQGRVIRMPDVESVASYLGLERTAFLPRPALHT